MTIAVVTAQLRFTVAAKPPEGVTVIVAVLPEVAPGAMVRLPLFVNVKLGLTGAGVTETFTFVVSIIVRVAASVPVTAIT